MGKNIDRDEDMTAIATLPLTREEMATYLKFLTDTITTVVEKKNNSVDLISQFELMQKADDKRTEMIVKSINDGFQTIANAITSAHAEDGNNLNKNFASLSKDVTRFNTVVTDSADMVRKAIFAAINSKPQSKVEKSEINPMFKNTLLPVQSSKWISDVWDSCEIIGRRSNKNKLQVLMDVYKNIEASGLDLTTLHSEWKNTEEGKLHKAKVHMCACDAFRPKVEEQLKALHKKYFPEKYESKDKPQMRYSKSLLAQRNPECVTSIIKAYGIKNNISFNKAQSKLYKKLAIVYNVENVSVLARQYAKQIGYSTCNSGYMIANNEEMFKKFKAIAEEE